MQGHTERRAQQDKALQGEEATIARVTAPEAAPMVSEQEQKLAEPRMPAVSNTVVPARSAAAESVTAKDAQPKEAGSSPAQPAQAVPATEEVLKAVPDTLPDQKTGSAEPASASPAAAVDVTPSGSVGKHFETLLCAHPCHGPALRLLCKCSTPYINSPWPALVTTRDMPFMGHFQPDTLPHVDHCY